MTLLVVGAAHVFQLEAPIQALIQRERPAVVALELDAARYEGLRQRAAGTYDAEAARRSAPRVYRRLARYQEDLAASLGSDVGAEMLAAARAAESVGSRIALIDVDAQQLVRRLWREMKLRERLRLFFSSLAARWRWGRSSSVEAEVARYQRDPVAYLDGLGKEYPTLKRVLLDDRNEHMAKRLRALLAEHGHVVAVVGDGHVDGLARLLVDLAPRTVRLAELRSMQVGPGVAWRFGERGDAVGFSFDQESREGALGRE